MKSRDECSIIHQSEVFTKGLKEDFWMLFLVVLGEFF